MMHVQETGRVTIVELRLLHRVSLTVITILLVQSLTTAAALVHNIASTLLVSNMVAADRRLHLIRNTTLVAQHRLLL